MIESTAANEEQEEAALAPCDYDHPEVTLFPKGHGAIATS